MVDTSNISIPNPTTKVKYPFSARADFHEKDMRGRNPADGWQRVMWSMTELFIHAASGKAVGVSVWKDGYRTAENALETRILGLDFEHGGLTAEALEADEWLKPYAGVIMPTASDTSEDPRARVFIPLSRSVTASEYRALYSIFEARYAGAIDPAAKDVARFFYGAHIEHGPQDDDGFTEYARGYVNDNALLDVDAFISVYSDSIPAKSGHSSDLGRSQVSEATEGEIEALIANFAPDFQPVSFAQIEKQEIREAADKLQFATRLYTPAGKPGYDLWLRLWMAVHSATRGSETMLELICTHPAFDVFWQYDKHENGRDQLRKAWAARAVPETADDGLITGRTLNFYARLCGWGSFSQFDLKRVDKVVSGRYLLDVLQPGDLPKGANILIKQQTGGGKTTFAFKVSEQFTPHKVLWIAPYTALNLDIAGKATMPMSHYKAAEKQGALTATLQYVTEKRFDPAHYDLIVIEEVHQALSHLVLKSHMKNDQIVKAIMWIRDALRSKATCLMVDAGINQNTVEFVERLSSQPAYIIVNEHIEPKSTIQLIETDTALDMLRNEPGKRVIAADRRDIARQYHDALGGDRPTGILITGENSDQKSQQAFASDVETSAAKYRDVVYNAAMGSGVSISDTTPDLLILAAGLLGASTLNQLLNRYRNQPETVYAVFDVRARARIDAQGARASVTRRYQSEYDSLQKLLGAATGGKSDIAKIVDDLHVKMLIEQNEQLIAPLLYFERIMAQDGRQVTGSARGAISETMQAIRRRNKAEVVKEYPNWRLGAVVDKQSEAEIEDMSRVELIRSALHTDVRDVFKRDPAPGGRWSDEQLYKAADRYMLGIGHIERALAPQVDFSGSAVTLYAADTAKHQAKLWAATYLLLKACSYLLPDLRGRIAHETIEQRGENFIALVRQLESQYDAVVERSRDYLHNLEKEQSGPELALTLLGKILGKVGINLKTVYRQTKVNGQKDRMRDANGCLVKDYTVEDVDLLVEVLAHRAAYAENSSEVVADVVNTVWFDGATDVEDYIGKLAESGQLVEWATKIQSGGRDAYTYRRQLALDLLYDDEDQDWL